MIHIFGKQNDVVFHCKRLVNNKIPPHKLPRRKFHLTFVWVEGGEEEDEKITGIFWYVHMK